jgi:hypothetical protein
MGREFTYDQLMQETKINRFGTVDALNLLGRERDVQRVNVLPKLLNLRPPDDREYVWGFVHEVRNRD